MILPNSVANEFRGSFRQQINILCLCLSYRGMKNDTSPFLVERLTRKKLEFIWFPFLTSLMFIEVHFLAIATSIICFTANITRVHTSALMWNSRLYAYLRQNSQFHHQASLSKCGLVNCKMNELPRHRDIKKNLVKTTRRWQRLEKNFV